MESIWIPSSRFVLVFLGVATGLAVVTDAIAALLHRVREARERDRVLRRRLARHTAQLREQEQSDAGLRKRREREEARG